MCGILGVSGKHSRHAFIKALESITHRGPDSFGLASYADEVKLHKKDKDAFLSSSSTISLGHRRLSIIDLDERADQPFVKHSKVICYNGEIFNYLEIKEELSLKGYKFKTNSDTEIVLSAYDCWGLDFVKRLNGMWSLAIVDNNKIVLSRDRYGIKPLYFSHSENSFAFSSEIKALMLLAEGRFSPNLEEVLRYLYWGNQEVSKETMIEEVFRVLPGQYMMYDLKTKKLTTNQYYSTDSLSEKPSGLQSNIEKLRSVFSNSIRLRMRSDVPVGITLSGGLDSSSILYEANNHSHDKARIKSFSIVYGDEHAKINEGPWIDKVSRHLKTQSHLTTPTYQDLRDNLDEFIATYDEPIGGTTFFAHWHLMRFVSTHKTKVLLEGQGGDEIFGGYLYASVINSPIKSLLKRNSNLSTKQLLKNLFYIFFPSLYEAVLGLKIRSELGIKSSPPKNLNRPFRHKKRLFDLLVNEVNTGLRILLRNVDRSSMHFSIESRLPFMDYNVVEAALQTPSKYKIRQGWTRYIQRRMFKNRLPDEVAWRKSKLGFPTPHQEWTENLWKDEEVYKVVENSSVLSQLGIGPNSVNSNHKWKVINIAYWEKSFWN